MLLFMLVVVDKSSSSTAKQAHNSGVRGGMYYITCVIWTCHEPDWQHIPIFQKVLLLSRIMPEPPMVSIGISVLPVFDLLPAIPSWLSLGSNEDRRSCGSITFKLCITICLSEDSTSCFSMMPLPLTMLWLSSMA